MSYDTQQDQLDERNTVLMEEVDRHLRAAIGALNAANSKLRRIQDGAEDTTKIRHGVKQAGAMVAKAQGRISRWFNN